MGIMKNRFYASFYITGYTYWDGLEVMDSLVLGTKLTLEVEPSNPYDANAVKILLGDVMLGYIPRDENESISKFLQLGYTDLFQVMINRVCKDAHPEKQISVVVKIIPKK